MQISCGIGRNGLLRADEGGIVMKNMLVFIRGEETASSSEWHRIVSGKERANMLSDRLCTPFPWELGGYVEEQCGLSNRCQGHACL